MRFQSALAALGAFGAVWVAPLGAQAQTSATEGHWIFESRLRFEGVAQDGLEDADALTLRARFGYETAVINGFRALVEAEGVGQLTDDFNDTVNGRAGFALVPDPETLEINRLQLAWAGEEGRRAVIGRQRIILDNARFVGNVGFRQNEQTFDAARLDARPADGLALTYIYIDGVRRIFGDDSPQGVWRSDSHVLHADVDLPLGKLNAYALWLDFQNAPAQSSATYGARWSHAWTDASLKPRVTLEVAFQSRYRGNAADFDLGYQHADVAIDFAPFRFALGGERLEGNGARGFSTPLATLHAFQGWADVFLNTPPDGVRDLYASASYATPPWPAAQPVTLSLVAHDFTDDSGGADFGTELNASARVVFNDNWSLEAKAADFDGHDPRFADRTKFWLALEYRL